MYVVDTLRPIAPAGSCQSALSLMGNCYLGPSSPELSGEYVGLLVTYKRDSNGSFASDTADESISPSSEHHSHGGGVVSHGPRSVVST